MAESLKFRLEPRDLLALENSGERMVPELSHGPTFWDHVYRYAFACRFVRGKRVLDVACGEGYGAAALRKAGAARVIGVDISEDACRHASRRYGVETKIGSAEEIPLADASVDVVVSFETIEHLQNPLRFLDECRRVLTAEGLVIISTPNKQTYSATGRPMNPYHYSEMTEDEFSSALKSKFAGVELYSQHPHWAPWWVPCSLCAEESPWDRVGLLRRLRRSAQVRLAPISVYDPSLEERNGAVDRILDLGWRGPSALIPHVLRRRRRWNGEQPFFFIATAVSSPRFQP